MIQIFPIPPQKLPVNMAIMNSIQSIALNGLIQTTCNHTTVVLIKWKLWMSIKEHFLKEWLFMPHEYSLWLWPWSLTHYLANNFWTVSVRALIFHMSTPCVKTFQCVPIFLPCDLDLGVWPYFITLTLVKILNSSCYSFGTSHEYYMRQDLSVGTNNFDLVTLEFDLLFMPPWLKIGWRCFCTVCHSVILSFSLKLYSLW